MARKNPPFDPKEISVEASSPWSQAAQVAVARLGVVSYRLGLFLATLSVLMASGIAALPNEPNRLLSLIFVGIIPALAVLATWWTLYWVLRLAGAVCKLAAPLLYSFLAYTAHSVWDLIARFAMAVIRRCLGEFDDFSHVCRCGLQRTMVEVAFCSALIMRLSIVAYRNLFMAITFPIRLAARILIAVLAQV